MTRRARSGLLYLLMASACQSTASSGGFSSLPSEVRSALETLSPSVLPAPPADVSNRFADDPAAAVLGQKLFFDASFSGRLLDPDNDGSSRTLGVVGQTGRVACAGCHMPESGFVDTRSIGGAASLAAGWGIRKTPSLLDIGQASLLMWDGRHDALYNQVFGPLESPLEMNSSRLFVAAQLARNYRADYEAIFGPLPHFEDPNRFPQLTAEATGCSSPTSSCPGGTHGSPGDGAEYDGLTADDKRAVTQAVVNLGKAIGAYERQLRCGPSRFDAWVHGDATALTLSEQNGAVLFVGKAECISCHSGPFFSDQAFHNVGFQSGGSLDAGDPGASVGVAAAIADPLNTHGEFSDGDDHRLPASVDPSLLGAFKTPMLRCLNKRPAFMHIGQITSLAAAIIFFDGGGGRNNQGTNELHSLGLTANERQDLVSFLLALDGPGPDERLLHAP